jgi:preprotein translocase subunit SecD
MIDDTQLQEPEIQEQATEETPVEQPEVAQQVPQEQPKPVQETDGQKSFRELRTQKEQIERERNEMQRRLKELEAKAENDEIMVGDDDIVEGKHLTKTVKELRKLKEEVRTYKEQASMLSVESRIKGTYSDFDKVVTMDNIEKLKNQYPELAASVDSTPDLYSKAVAAYTLIQKFGLNESDPYMQDKMKAQANAAKPRPLASVSPQQGGSPMEKANAFATGLTPELKAQLLKEMTEAQKNYN